LLQTADPSVRLQDLRDELAAIEYEYPLLWLARNKPGGMIPSQQHLAELGLRYG
jgi:hypothetical protein